MQGATYEAVYSELQAANRELDEAYEPIKELTKKLQPLQEKVLRLRALAAKLCPHPTQIEFHEVDAGDFKHYRWRKCTRCGASDPPLIEGVAYHIEKRDC